MSVRLKLRVRQNLPDTEMQRTACRRIAALPMPTPEHPVKVAVEITPVGAQRLRGGTLLSNVARFAVDYGCWAVPLIRTDMGGVADDHKLLLGLDGFLLWFNAERQDRPGLDFVSSVAGRIEYLRTRILSDAHIKQLQTVVQAGSSLADVRRQNDLAKIELEFVEGLFRAGHLVSLETTTRVREDAKRRVERIMQDTLYRECPDLVIVHRYLDSTPLVGYTDQEI